MAGRVFGIKLWNQLLAIVLVSLVFTFAAFKTVVNDPVSNQPLSPLDTLDSSKILTPSTNPISDLNAKITFGVVVDSTFSSSRSLAIFKGLQLAIKNNSHTQGLSPNGNLTKFAVRRAESRGTLAGEITASTIFVADRLVNIVVSDLNNTPSDIATLLAIPPLRDWDIQGSKGNNPALISVIPDDSIAGGLVLGVSLTGHSKSFRASHRVSYDGKSPIVLKYQTQVTSHASPGGAYFYLRGLNSEMQEVARIFYSFFENWDIKTSAPNEKHDYYAIRTDFQQTELGSWITSSLRPKDDFDSEFPMVWESLDITSLELEFSAWTDSEISVKFANPQLLIEDQVPGLRGAQLVTEPNNTLLFAADDSSIPIPGRNTFMITPSTEMIINAVYSSLKQVHPGSSVISVIRTEQLTLQEILLIEPIFADEFQSSDPKAGPMQPFIVNANNLAETLVPALENNPDVLDLGMLTPDLTIKIISTAQALGFSGYILSYTEFDSTITNASNTELEMIAGLIMPGVPWNNPIIPEGMKHFALDYEELFGSSPSLIAAYAHEFILPSLIHALSTTLVMDSTLNIDQLALASWNTIFGNASFSNGSDGISRRVVISVPVSQISKNGVEYLGVF